MKISKFNISQPYQGAILLYNTYSTSIVELEPELYNAIFERQELSEYPEVKQLVEMGFIIEDSLDELEEQRYLRDTVISTSGDIISNIIIAPTLQCNAHCFYCFEKGHRKVHGESNHTLAGNSSGNSR